MTTIQQIKQDIKSALGFTEVSDKEFTKGRCNGILLNRLDDSAAAFTKAVALRGYNNKEYWEYALVIAESLRSAKKVNELEECTDNTCPATSLPALPEDEDEQDSIDMVNDFTREEVQIFEVEKHPLMYTIEICGEVAKIYPTNNPYKTTYGTKEQWMSVIDRDNGEDTFDVVNYIWLTDDWDYCKRSSNITIDMFLLAFNIKLTVAVIEIYCAEMSKDFSGKGLHPEMVVVDDLGTKAMWLANNADDLMQQLLELEDESFLGYGIYEWINASVDTIQPMLKDDSFGAFCNALEATESEEEFNNRIVLEKMYHQPMQLWYWDTSSNRLLDRDSYLDCAMEEMACIPSL
ncbi:hypothetical protein [Nostoc sp.]|uniref:hypothetical protein n=1 Tax=Nostoc sp. TaxID=1180 RepID=UPI002FF53E16